MVEPPGNVAGIDLGWSGVATLRGLVGARGVSRPAQTMGHLMSDRCRFIETYEVDEELDGARGPILFDVILALSFMLWIALLMIVGVI